MRRISDLVEVMAPLSPGHQLGARPGEENLVCGVEPGSVYQGYDQQREEIEDIEKKTRNEYDASESLNIELIYKW